MITKFPLPRQTRSAKDSSIAVLELRHQDFGLAFVDRQHTLLKRFSQGSHQRLAGFHRTTEEDECLHANWELRNFRYSDVGVPGYSGDKYCLDCGACFERGTETLPLEPNQGQDLADQITNDNEQLQPGDSGQPEENTGSGNENPGGTDGSEPSGSGTSGTDSPQEQPPAGPETPEGESGEPSGQTPAAEPEEPVTPSEQQAGEPSSAEPEVPVALTDDTDPQQAADPEQPAVQPEAQPEQQAAEPEQPVISADIPSRSGAEEQASESEAPVRPQPDMPAGQVSEPLPEETADQPAVIPDALPDEAEAPAAQEPDPAPSAGNPGQASGRKHFSEQFPFRRIRMNPEPGIRAEAAGSRIWPRAASPLQQMMSGD